MLVLSRGRNESIRIGDEIEITVLSIGPHSVRIGIKAPAEFKILRSELLDSEPDGYTADE